MKNLLKFASMSVMALVAAVSLSSCLGDGDDYQVKPFTQEEKIEAINVISSSYSGIYLLSNEKHPSMQFQIKSDSTIVVGDLPVKELSSAFASNYPEVEALLKLSENQTLEGVVHPLYADQVGNIYVVDYKPLTFNITKPATATEEETQVPVKMTFSRYKTLANVGTYSAYGCYQNGMFEGNIILSSINIDGKEIGGTLFITFQGRKTK